MLYDMSSGCSGNSLFYNILLMLKKAFRIRYDLHSIQTRSNPLFNKTKAYIIIDSHKRFIADGMPYQNNKICFQDAVEQQIRPIIFDQTKKKAQNCFSTVVIQFDAEGRTIKMGQALINLADIINLSRNGQVSSYKLQKSYDKGAKVNVTISFFDVDLFDQREQNAQNHVDYRLHSKSYCQLAKSKIKMRNHNENNKYMFTDYSMFSEKDEEKEENLSNISGKKTYFAGEKNTLRNKEFGKQMPDVNLQRQLIDAKSQNKIYQHELANLQMKFQEIQEQISTLKQKLDQSETANYHLDSHCQQLKKQVNTLQQSKQILKDQLNIQVNKFSKMYQESEKERNKLLMEIDNMNKVQNQKRKDQDRLHSQQKLKIKELERNQQVFRKKIEEYNNKINVLDRQLKTQKKSKQKSLSLCQELKMNLSNRQQQIKSFEQEMKKGKSQKEQAMSQLQISKFSLKQYEKDLTNYKRHLEQKGQLIRRLEAQLLISNKVIKQQRGQYTKRLQEFQMKTQREQKNMQAYLEQLQMKSMNEQSKNGMINSLKKQLAKVKKTLDLQKQHYSELEQQINSNIIDKQKLESRIVHEQNKHIDLIKEKSFLQSQVSKLRGQVESNRNQSMSQDNTCLSQQQKQELTMICYQQRDNYWKIQIQKIEKDLRNLMDKNKKDKQGFEMSILRLSKALEQKEVLLGKKDQQYKNIELQQQKLKKQIKEFLLKQDSSDQLNKKINQQLKKQKEAVHTLNKAVQNYAELQLLLQSKEKEIVNQKAQIQKLKKENDKTVAMLKKVKNDIKDLSGFINGYLMKNQKYKIYFEQFQCESIDHEFVDIINSSLKHYCQKMNKMKGKLQQLDVLKEEAEETRKRVNSKKSNKTFVNEKIQDQWSFDSRISNISNQFKEGPHTNNMLSSIYPSKESISYKKDMNKVLLLQKEHAEYKNKLANEIQQNSDLQKQVQKLNQSLLELKQKIKRLSDQNQNKYDQVLQLNEKLKSKDKNIDKLKEQCKQLNSQISQLKNELQSATKALKNEKNQVFKRNQGVNRSMQQQKSDKMYDNSYLKFMQLQTKYKIAQDEIQRLKKEKDEKRNDHMLQNRQTKLFESKITQKEQIIISLKKQIQEQKNNLEKSKEIFTLKLRKLKQEHELQLQQKIKAHKQIQKSYKQLQQKYRQALKRYKTIQESLKNMQTKLTTNSQKQDKNKKIIINQWELKCKTMKNQHQSTAAGLKTQIEHLKSGQKVTKQVQRKRQKEIKELRVQLQRKDRTISEINQKLYHLSDRIKYMQQQQSNLKALIVVLQDKIKDKSVEESSKNLQKEIQKDNFQSKSNYSLKTFTFK